MKLNLAPLALRFALGLAFASLAFADISGGHTLSGPTVPGTFGNGADPLFDFTFSSVLDNGYGSLDATSLGGGVFLATSGSLTVTTGQDHGTYSLYLGGPAQTTSPSGYFYYDDLLYSSAPGVDNDGLLFTNGSSLEINIFSNPGNYQFYDNTGYNNYVGFAVPEASTVVLLSFLLAGLGGFTIRRKV